MRLSLSILVLASLWLSYPCHSQQSESAPAPQAPPDFQLNLINTAPHNTANFTQGLFFHEGVLYESTGQYGESALIRYSADGKTEQLRRNLLPQYFGEGASWHKDRIYQLTWKAGKALAYQSPELNPTKGFNYKGEGWGLTSDGQHLWLSNGSDQLQVLDTEGNIARTLNVTYKGKPVNRLNELEWIEGWLLANRWYDHHILVIDPDTGEVANFFNLSPFSAQESKHSHHNVLNGIAWDPITERLWITGKYWRQFLIAEIKLP